MQVQGEYNATAQSLTSGQTAGLQLNSAGELKVAQTPQSTSVPVSSLSISGVANVVPLALYKATNPTLVSGQENNFLEDFNGYLKVVPSYNFSTITSLTTTTVKSGAGTLHSIAITSTAMAGKIGIYNATTVTGNAIMTINISGVAATYVAMPLTLPLNIDFSTGLTVLTSGNAQKILVSYR